MASAPFVGKRPDDMTLDEFLRVRVRQMIREELSAAAHPRQEVEA